MKTRAWASAAVIFAAAIAACGEKSTSGPSPTASATVAVTAEPRPIDLTEFCGKVCKRAAACGAETAAALAKAGGAKDKAALDAAKPADVEAACVSSCKAETAPTDAGPAVAKATKCLDDTTCEGFSACLEAASGPKPAPAK